MSTNLIALLTIFIPLATAFVGYVVGKRKTTAEAASVELTNVEHAIKIWRGIAEDLSSQVTALRQEISDLRGENAQLKSEMQGLKKQIHDANCTININ